LEIEAGLRRRKVFSAGVSGVGPLRYLENVTQKRLYAPLARSYIEVGELTKKGA